MAAPGARRYLGAVMHEGFCMTALDLQHPGRLRPRPTGRDVDPRLAAGNPPLPMNSQSSDTLSRAAAREFRSIFGAPASSDPLGRLASIGEAFARIPYENLSKLIRDEEEGGQAARARRSPLEVLEGYRRLGTGGTCFSLTETLLRVVRGMGYEADPVLADRRYGESTHCALLVSSPEGPRLVDPGFLLVRPVLLPERGETAVEAPPHRVILRRLEGSDRVELWTEHRGDRRYRLTLRATPADPGEFRRAWDASFDWDMMRYPLLTRVRAGRQSYLQGRRLQHRSPRGVERQEIPEERLASRIAAEFGVDIGVVERALTILRRRGERHGDAPRP